MGMTGYGYDSNKLVGLQSGVIIQAENNKTRFHLWMRKTRNPHNPVNQLYYFLGLEGGINKSFSCLPWITGLRQ